SGRRLQAGRSLDYIAGRFCRPDGDLDGTGVPWFDRFHIYPHAWLAAAALKLSRPDVADPLIRFLISRWNGKTGGFRAGVDRTEEIMTTSMAGLACLWAGQEKVAGGVAAWLERMHNAQPDLRRGLYHVWHPETGLVKDDAYLVNAAELKQWYFMYGIAAAF